MLVCGVYSCEVAQVELVSDVHPVNSVIIK